MTCSRIYDSAAYVLGTLPGDERTEYEQHLATCAECQAEVADFAGMPALLGRVDLAEVAGLVDEARWAGPTARPDEARWAGPTAVPGSEARWAGPTAVPPTEGRWAGPTATPPAQEPDNVLPFVLKEATRRRNSQRRRGRLQTVGAALLAACLAVLAVVGVQRITAPGSPTEPAGPQLLAMRQVAAVSPVRADVGVEAFPGGSKVTMHCMYNAGEDRGKWTFRMVVVPKYGQPEEVGSWTANFGDDVTYPAYTRFAPKDIAKIELRKGDGTVLLTREMS